MSRLRRCTTRWGRSPSKPAPLLLPPAGCVAGTATGADVGAPAGVPGAAAPRAAAMLAGRGALSLRAGVPIAVPLSLGPRTAKAAGDPTLEDRLPLPAVRMASMALICSWGTPAARAATMVPRCRPSDRSESKPARWLPRALLPPAIAMPRLLAELQLLVLPSARAPRCGSCGGAAAGSPGGRLRSIAAAWLRRAKPRWLSSATCRIAPAPWPLAPASRAAAALPPRWLRRPWLLPSKYTLAAEERSCRALGRRSSMTAAASPAATALLPGTLPAAACMPPSDPVACRDARLRPRRPCLLPAAALRLPLPRWLSPGLQLLRSISLHSVGWAGMHVRCHNSLKEHKTVKGRPVLRRSHPRGMPTHRCPQPMCRVALSSPIEQHSYTRTTD